MAPSVPQEKWVQALHGAYPGDKKQQLHPFGLKGTEGSKELPGIPGVMWEHGENGSNAFPLGYSGTWGLP